MKTEVETQIEQLLRKGERWNIIAKTLHVSKTTILKVSRRLNEETSTISATEVFTMFEHNPPKSPIDIVKEFNANPTTIRDWFDAWLDMNESWKAWQKAKESMAKAQEKGGEEAKTVEEAEEVPPFERERKDWKKALTVRI